MEDRPPYGDDPGGPRMMPEDRLSMRYVCCVCGKVEADIDLLRDAECVGFVRIVEEDEIKIWSEPGERAALVRSKFLAIGTDETMELRINGAHRIVSERVKATTESSPNLDAQTPPGRPLTARERAQQVPIPPGLEVIWLDDEDEATAFVLPGRGRAAGETPPRPTEDDQSDS